MEKIKNRITNDKIVSLLYNQIFVFGSNLAGIHGAGAAKFAHDRFGAIMYQGTGLQGQSYAIPSKNHFLQVMGIQNIKPFVDEFIEFAKNNTDKVFLVTEVGCGLASMKYEDIAPLFKDAIDVENIHLPENFWKILI